MQRPGALSKIEATSSSSESDVSEDTDEDSLPEFDQSSVISEDTGVLSPVSDTPSVSDLSSELSNDDKSLPHSIPISVDEHTSMETNHSEDAIKEFGYIIVGDNLDHTVRPRYFELVILLCII